MRVEVVLSPTHGRALTARLAAEYDPRSRLFHHWLPKGAFARRYAPAGERARVAAYLRSTGLRVVASGSPFLVAAAGPARVVETAFGTGIEDYRTTSGVTFFAATGQVRLPGAVAGGVAGVIGLTDLVREHPMDLRRRPGGSGAPRYGAGPQGSGLTPGQTMSLYGGRRLFRVGGRRGLGRGVTLAVFELSAYARSDIDTWARHYYGRGFRPPLVDVPVDGGSITPRCPSGDRCSPGPDYSGDTEVTADIEQDLAVAPHVRRLLVYDAPDDVTGETTVAEYDRIAADDAAASVSTSWGLCEQDLGLSVARAESTAFLEMALQGQSLTAASGDNGPYDCIADGTRHAQDIAVDDPASQPLVTAVGGTSWGSYNPRGAAAPRYPRGRERVWNPGDSCNATAPGRQACLSSGAGGGGVSRFWAKGAYQTGAHVRTSFSRRAPYCRTARHGAWCRELPDVSADADSATGYSAYCAGPDFASNSTCAQFPGWSATGGTSLSAPLWAALVADTVSYHGGARLGDADYELYRLYRTDPHRFFHDITGRRGAANNGRYPATRGYDLATGIGSPVMWAIAEAHYRFPYR